MTYQRRLRRRGRVAIAAFSALAAGFAGCSPGDDTTPVVAGSDWAAGEGEEADSDLGSGVPQALRFTADLVGGGTFSGEAVADRPVVFWFWVPT